MLQDLISEISNEVIRKIEQNLVEFSSSQNPVNIDNALQEPIQQAFKKVIKSFPNKNDRKQAISLLYHKLSFSLHPDKISIKQPRIYAILNANNSCSLPQRYVVEIKAKAINDVPIFQELNVPNIFFQIEMLKRLCTERFMTIYITKLIELFLEWVRPIYNEYNRYPEPIRSFIFYARLIMPVALYIGLVLFSDGITATLLYGLLTVLPSFLERYNQTRIVMLNAVTRGAYDDECESRITNEQLEKFARNELFYSFYRDMNDCADSEELIIAYAQKFCNTEYVCFNSTLSVFTRDLEHNQQIIDELRKIFIHDIKNKIITDMKMNAVGLKHLESVFFGFYNAITKPFPTAWTDILTSISLRLAQAILMPIVLIIEAVRPLLNLLFLTSIVLLVAPLAFITFIPLIVLGNLPLYMYDGLSAVINWISSILEAIQLPRSNINASELVCCLVT